jgi:hypothetical protein
VGRNSELFCLDKFISSNRRKKEEDRFHRQQEKTVYVIEVFTIFKEFLLLFLEV